MIRALGFILMTLACGSAAAACEGRIVEGPTILGGSACVPEKPERIIVLDPTYSLGMAVELGLPVVGAPLTGMSDTALRDEAVSRNVENLGSFAEPAIEKIVALQPDLILGTALAGEGVLKMASQIAPTLLIGAEDWKDYYRIVADATGTRQLADEKLAAFEKRAAHIREKMPDRTVSIVRITPWDFQVYLDGPNAYGPFAVLRDAGVKRTDYETVVDQQSLKRPDWEQLAALDGNILLYIVGGANDSAESGRHEEVINNPLWRMLPAVKSGNTHRVDAGTWMEFSGINSANRVLDDVERYVLGYP